ncbi:NAD(P)/FAD-dependent oxidoreductase [Crossiella sp. CA198]|uniref:NAD(P)/FAD-dependent oxidoreductase n=1 Tax=Crossiella sp. CA198 TaxID=3455607 RepID=UPI003F8D322C
MTHRIVILGAGYAGLAAANRLSRLLPAAHLTLVNRAPHFVERVRLHQLAAGQSLRRHPLPGYASTGTVTGIDLAARTVHLDTGNQLRYDTLVYALGSSADLDTVPGVREHAFALADQEAAHRLRAHLPTLPDGARLTVVGGGLTGIEAATELAEARPDLHVSLLSRTQPGAWLSPAARRHLDRALTRLGITTHHGSQVSKLGPDTVHLADGTGLRTDLTVWAAGFRVPALAAEAGLAVDAHGRLLVDDHLRSISHPEVYGIGDAAAGARMSCQTGLPMGRYAATDIARGRLGRRTRPIRIRYVWQNISLGRRDGITQFTRPDDTPVNAVLTGRISALFKEFITRGAAWTTRR